MYRFRCNVLKCRPKGKNQWPELWTSRNGRRVCSWSWFVRTHWCPMLQDLRWLHQGYICAEWAQCSTLLHACFLASFFGTHHCRMLPMFRQLCGNWMKPRRPEDLELVASRIRLLDFFVATRNRHCIWQWCQSGSLVVHLATFKSLLGNGDGLMVVIEKCSSSKMASFLPLTLETVLWSVEW